LAEAFLTSVEIARVGYNNMYAFHWKMYGDSEHFRNFIKLETGIIKFVEKTGYPRVSESGLSDLELWEAIVELQDSFAQPSGWAVYFYPKSLYTINPEQLVVIMQGNDSFG